MNRSICKTWYLLVGMGRWFAVALAMVAVLIPSTSVAQAEGGSQKERILQVVRLDGSESQKEREAAFVEELKLAVDNCEIRDLVWTNKDLASLSMSEILHSVRTASGTTNVIATIWLEDTRTSVTTLNLVALSEGRAFVKVVEAPNGPNTSAELAFAVQALLVEASLFKVHETEEKKETPPSSWAPPPNEDAPSNKSPFSMGLLFKIGSGIAGHQGPSLKLGGSFIFEYNPMGGLYLRLNALVEGRPIRDTNELRITGWGVGPAVDIGYSFGSDKFMLGPFVEMGAVFDSVALEPLVGDAQVFKNWSFYGAVGIDMRFMLNNTVSFVLWGMWGAYATSQEIVQLSDNTVILTTPRLDWRLLLGLTFRL